MANNKKVNGFKVVANPKESKYGFKTVPNESVPWKLQSGDGTYFGDVSYDAYKAVKEGTLDSYKPKSDDEKNIITDFKNHLGIPITGEDGNVIGNVSYGAYKALSEDKLDSYKPINNNEKKVLDSYKKQVSKYEKVEKSEKTEQKDGLGSWLGKQFMSGLGNFNKGVFATLDLVLPTDFMGRYDFISNLNTYYDNMNEHYSTEAQKSSESRGKGWKTAGDVVSGAVAALPNAIIAFMSSGASLAGSASSTFGAASSSASIKVSSALKNSVQTMMKNPSYWTSVMRTLGTDYEEAKERGANDFVASATAILTTALNAGIEVGGGIEKLSEKSGNAVLRWVKSSFEEGGEESLQRLTTNAMAKLMYDSDAPFVSLTDEKAVLNPITLAKEFGMGVAVGGMLGGGQTLAATAINSARIAKTGEFFNQPDIVQAIVDTGLESPEDSMSYKLAKKAEKKAGKLSDYEVGRQTV